MEFHRQLAVSGVGYGHRLLASIGMLWFGLRVVVRPIPRSGGGGSRPDLPYVEEFRVSFFITYKKKKWTKSFITGTPGLATLEKVLATFMGISTVIHPISVAAIYINTVYNKIILKVTRK